MNTRAKGIIRGIVQGVGFRPFIYQLASRHQLAGYVINTSQGVDVEVEGPETVVECFMASLISEAPPLASIASAEWQTVPIKHEDRFEIKQSHAGKARSTLISPDVSVCSDCLSELTDPKDRRFGYPFINCTNCGPRYTIIMDIPYDRATTTMKKFQMCRSCQSEYEDPNNRRFHAQPNACRVCGPKVTLHDENAEPLACPEPMAEAIRLLKGGSILAIKGLGGFHLAVDAANHRAVIRLRKRKHREEKPLAVMVKDLDSARKIAHISELEAQTLTSHQRPIVLLRKRRFHGLSSQVAPKNQYFGVMLPYTPLHHLLMAGPFRALIMTSGNKTEEPINIDNQDAFENLRGIADYFLVHDRDIYLRSDDSVVRIVDQSPRQIRRSRGYVPVPLYLSEDLMTLPSVLGVGAELKNTLCLTKENRAFLSQHIGDMENLETLGFFLLTVSHLQRILEISPQVLAHDLHPDYLSSKYARDQKEIPIYGVQHHHAHIVSCLAEHGLQGPVIGLAMDGTGYGTDGQIWGGEVLIADLTSFRRTAHLDYVRLPGGDLAARFPWRMALVYLQKVYGNALFQLPIPFVKDLDRDQTPVILQMAQKGVNSPFTSSCGRLFDAVSSLLGIRHRIAYEGQAAIELEMCQNPRENGSYPWQIKREGDHWVMSLSSTIEQIVRDLLKGLPKGVISKRFHNTLIRLFTDICLKVRAETGIGEVALSGGSFQNVTLLTGLTRALRSTNFSVHGHAIVPTNDGGLALGQAVCAGLKFAGFRGKYEEG